MKKTYSVVMLPTKKESILYFHNPTESLRFDYKASDISGVNDYQHLYFTYDSDIKIGDIALIPNGMMQFESIEIVTKSNIDTLNSLNAIPIIASTDKTLTPKAWINDYFINDYVVCYANRNIIRRVDLIIISDDNIKGYPEFGGNGIIKTREDGSVIIHEEKTYSEEEVISIAQEAWIESFFKKRNTDITGFDEWKNKFIIGNQ